METNAKQLELAASVPAIIGLLPENRQEMVLKAGQAMIAAMLPYRLTIPEQQAAITVADLYMQFCHEDTNHQKWSNLMEAMIRQENC